jgi:hypothetical protein
MLLKNTIAAIIFGSILVSLPAFSQEHQVSETEIGVQACVHFVENINADPTQQTVAVNHSFLGDYHFLFNKHTGIEPSHGYTHDTQTYNLNSGSSGVKDNSDRVSTAYVFRLPVKRWSSFVLASAHFFDPKTIAGASKQTWPGHPHGTDADFNLKYGVFPKKERRGVFYNSATSNMDGLSSLYRYTNTQEPAFVVGYSF